jgi:hypothetical protein
LIILYKKYGAGDFTMLDESYSSEQIRQIKYNADRLLKHRGYHQSAEYLKKIPFTIREAYNNFGDEFSILYAMVPLEIYEGLRIQKDDPEGKHEFSKIAEVLNEIGPYIRFIAVDLATEVPRSMVNSLRSLRQSEIHKLVYGYIGVDGGYLGDFSYRTHHEFYIML